MAKKKKRKYLGRVVYLIIILIFMIVISIYVIFSSFGLTSNASFSDNMLSTIKQGILALNTPIPSPLPTIEPTQEPLKPTTIPLKIPEPKNQEPITQPDLPPLPPNTEEVNPPIQKSQSGKACPVDSPKVNCDCIDTEREVLACSSIKMVDPFTVFFPDNPEFASKKDNPDCFQACYGKPVIYLYPEREMNIDVKMQTSGIIFASDPLYENGWKNILAYPSGKLEYQGKTYRELFYETKLDEQPPQPTTGVFIPRAMLFTQLSDLTKQLGLLPDEQKEFLDYWIPKLQNRDIPYYFVSIIGKEYKEITDKLIISPQPDTFIEFIVYFKPVQIPFTVNTLMLPPTPIRKGFTAVEWGGVIIE
ncbi:MAG: hypothetical protein WCO06_04845 [Candidatus Roizmanbacteria bacterium]